MHKYMRVLVFFDLPVQTPAERKKATQFRNFLLNDGYYMLQFSVYARLCNGVDAANDVFNRLTKSAPQNGSVRCMIVTEKQYSQMKIISGPKKKPEKPVEFYQMSFL